MVGAVNTRGSPHAQRQQVGSEKSNSKAKAEVGAQAGGEIEQTQGCYEKGTKVTGCRHYGVARSDIADNGRLSLSRGLPCSGTLRWLRHRNQPYEDSLTPILALIGTRRLETSANSKEHSG
jgi:hypothetical protein